MKEIKSYFKDVSTLREFETKARNLLRQKDSIIAHLKTTDVFKELLESIKNYPSSYIYFNKVKMVKHYCPVCGHRETVEHKMFSRHTCNKENIDKSKGEGYEDFSWSNNNFSSSFSFSPFGYSDAIMTARVNFIRVLDEDYASLDESDFVILEKSKFDIEVNIGNDVIGYSDKHKLRLLNNNNNISDNLSILDRGYLRNNVIRYEHLGGVDAIKDSIDPDMLEYVYTRKVDDNQISLIDDIKIPDDKFVKHMFLRGNFDKSLKRKNTKKRSVPTRSFEIDYDKIFNNIEKIKFFYIQKKYEINNKTTYDVHCNNCKETFELSFDSHKYESKIPIKCSCGLEVDSLYSAYKKGSDFTVIVSDVIDGKYVQMIVDVRFSYDIDFNNTVCHEDLMNYGVRISKLSIVEEGDEGLEIKNYRHINENYSNRDDISNVFIPLRKSNSSSSGTSYNYYYNVITQGGYSLMNSIIDNVKISNIKYSGYDILVEHIFKAEINDSKSLSDIYGYFDISNRDSYLRFWTENPKIERFVKDPLLFETLYSATAEQLFHPSRGNLSISSDPKSKNILNIRKDAYSYVNDLYKNKDHNDNINLSLLETIYTLDFAYEQNNKNLHKEEIKSLMQSMKLEFNTRDIRDIDLFKTVVNWDNNSREYLFSNVSNMVNNIVEIFNNNNISYKRIANYITHVFYNQCIKPKEALQIWKDYLYMIKYLDYDHDDKETIFPRSLKKEHDIATFAFEVVQNEHKEKIFRANMSNFKHLAYKGKKLSIVIPEETSDIVREGSRLNHCVASYILRISPTRAILFVRKNDELDTPYYTIEINNNAIVQVSGFSNKRPDNEVNLFLSEFAKFNKLKCAY